jgi:serine/threonine protein kinase
MSETVSNVVDQDLRLTQVLDAYLAGLPKGTAPNPEELLAQHPDLAEDLRECLDCLAFIQQAAQAADAAAVPGATASQESAPRELGDFRILREVGKGGMGVVYEAEQLSLGRRVALKVLPFAATLDPRQLQRFKNEAQAAAGLHHKNIVPVHFVGCERGVHFYAMQFIDGQTLAAIIAELRRLAGRDQSGSEASPVLSAAAEALVRGQTMPEPEPANGQDPTIAALKPRRRDFNSVPPGMTAAETSVQAATSLGRSLRNPAYFASVARLGVQAAEALEHAHALGVVHRDIKPGNLLLDGRSNLWITDFGLAHCQSQAGLTMSGDLVGTLRYMSPEQALAKRVVVDHRTDIYSLGATLYELLTLEPAFAGSDREELLQQIAFEEPKAPRRHNKAIPADLETIVLKALAKNPAERYTTAQEVADDLRRYLEHKPIHARRPTLVQRLRKWARRHQGMVRAAVAGLVLAFTGLAVGTVLIWQEKEEKEQAYQKEAAERARAEANEKRAKAERNRAEQEKLIAQAVRHFLLYRLLRQADIDVQADALLMAGRTLAEAKENPTIGELLDRAAAELTPDKIEAQFPQQPLVQADILHTIGVTYRGIGANAPAIAHLRRAHALKRRQLGPNHPETLTGLHNLAIAYRKAGQLPVAIRLCKQVRDKQLDQVGPDNPSTLSTLNSLALAYCEAGKLSKATRLLEQVRDKQVEKLGREHPATLTTLNNLGLAYKQAGKLPEAIRLFEQVGDQRVKKLGPDHPETLGALNNLAAAYDDARRLPEAIRLYEQVQARHLSTHGANHPETLTTLNNLAVAYQHAGRLREAIRVFKQLRDKTKAKLGRNHPLTLTTLCNLADAYRDAGKLPEAIRLLEQVRDKEVAKDGDDHPATLTTLHSRAFTYMAAGKLPEAIRLFEQVRRGRVKNLGPDHPQTLETLNNLAGAYLKAGKLPEAIRLFEQVRDKHVEKFPPDLPDSLITLHNLACAYQMGGKSPEAVRLFEQIRQVQVKKLGHDDPNTLNTLFHIAWAYREAGRLEKAESLSRDGLEQARKRFGEDHPHTADWMACLGGSLLQQRRYAKAEPVLRVCLAIRARRRPHAWTTFNSKSVLGSALLGQKKYADAEPLLLEGFQGMKQRQVKIPIEGQIRLTEALERLVQLYDAWGKKEKAAQWRKKLDEVKTRKQP